MDSFELLFISLFNGSTHDLIRQIEVAIKAKDLSINVTHIDTIEEILQSGAPSIPAIKLNDKIYTIIDNKYFYDGTAQFSIEELLKTLG